MEISGAKTPPKVLPKDTQKLPFSENGEAAIRQLFTTLQPCWPLPNSTQNHVKNDKKRRLPTVDPKITQKSLPAGPGAPKGSK